MKTFKNNVLNETYIKLYTSYDSLVRDMRVYWEENSEKTNYYNRFIDEFSKRNRELSNVISNYIFDIKDQTTYIIDKETLDFVDSIMKLFVDLHHHYIDYHIGKNLSPLK